MKQIYAFTSAARNYLPKVRLLIDSLRRHHPEFRIVLAIADDPPDPALISDWDEILPLQDLGIAEWRQWAFTHNIVELSTAIKPFVLSRLLERPDCAGVFYFDPDMVLFSPLHDMVERLQQSNVVLTPHQNKPEAGMEQVIDNEICSLKHGTYNLGFVGVRPTETGKAFARWWSERVYYFCRDDIPNGLFTDQRWIDLAPALFDGVQVVRSSRFNVAPWNLTTRRFSGSFEQGYTVDGEALGFYHFTGYDSGAHRIMVGKYNGKNADLMGLVDWYERETGKTRDDPLSRQPWAFGRFGDGAAIKRAHRLIYRSRTDLQRQYKDPFAADSGDSSTFAGWCRSQGAVEYPDLLPEPAPDADWSSVTGRLIPSIAPPAGAMPSLSSMLMSAATDPQQARRLARQTMNVVRREGLRGLFRRIGSRFKGT